MGLVWPGKTFPFLISISGPNMASEQDALKDDAFIQPFHSQIEREAINHLGQGI